MKINLKSLLEIVSESTETNISEVDINSSMDTLTGWDSLGHLSILSKLDNATGGKAAEIQTLADCKSVNDLIESLKSKSLFSE